MLLSSLFFHFGTFSQLKGQALTADGIVQEISYSGSYEEFRIPGGATIGDYDIIFFDLKGADGGKRRVGTTTKKGGGGAKIKVSFAIGNGVGELQRGGKIRFIVGHKGGSTSTSSIAASGGGGGTGILYTENPDNVTCDLPSTDLADADHCWVILAVAGGGGGAYQSGLSDGASGKSGNSGTCGDDGSGLEAGDGACNGNGGHKGGSGAFVLSGGGGGAKESGGGQLENKHGRKGGFTGGNGGSSGIVDGGFGYGGGGSGRKVGSSSPFEGAGGGGGGGYSGGGGGDTNAGGGGGSFVNAAALSSEKKSGDKDGSPDNGKLSYQFWERDPLVPVANCKDVTITLNGGTYSLSPGQVNNGSTAEPGEQITRSFAAKLGIGGIPIYIPIPSLGFDCDDIGEVQRIFMVESTSGKKSICTFNVEIVDEEAPTAACTPFPIIGEVGSGEEYTLDPSLVDIGSADACGVIVDYSLSKEVFTCEDLGSNTVTLYVEDNSGNVGSCAATLDVTETLSEIEITCPPSQQITLDQNFCNQTALGGLGPVSFTNLCNYNLSYEIIKPTSASVQGTGELGFYTFQVGTTQITYNLNLNNTNTNASCSFSYELLDVFPPTALCQNVTVSLVDANANLVDLVDGGSSDNCGFPQLSLSETSFDCTDLGENQVVLTVTDNSENSSTCTATVTIVDSTQPIANCQTVTVQLDVNGVGSLTAAAVDAGSSDNCGLLSMALNNSNFDCEDVGDQNLILTVTDESGNSSICTATAKVEDNIPPVVTCTDVTVELSWPVGNPYSPYSSEEVLLQAQDACGIDINPIQTIYPNCNSIGSFLQTVNKADHNGNIGSCTAMITIVDLTPPNARCKNATIQLDATGNASLSIHAVDNNSNDHCGIQSLVLSQEHFDCTDLGNHSVMLTVTDNNNNASTCNANITVADNFAATALCQPVTVQLDANGNGSIAATAVDAGSTDVCGPVTLAVSPGDFGCNEVGNQSITLTVTDASGNTATCSSSAMVEDNVPPIITCSDVTVELTWNALGFPVGEYSNQEVLSSSTDACGFEVDVFNNVKLACNKIGSFVQTVNKQDVNGNSSSCAATVTVVELTPPNAQCKNATIQLDETGNAMLNADAIDNNSSDHCGIQSLALSQTSFDCMDSGTATVTLTVTDANNNTSNCTATVILEDNIRPEINCPAGGIFPTLPGQCEAHIVLNEPIASDNCAVTVLRYRFRQVDTQGTHIPGALWTGWSTDPVIHLPVGYWKIQWQAKDAANNQKKCHLFIEVQDNEEPVAACHNTTITFNGEATIPLPMDQLWNESASSDNCADLFFISSSVDEVSCDQLGSTIPVIVIIEDAAGNPASCNANVTVAGLPCNWAADPDGINCSNGVEAGYDPALGIFDLTTTGCFDPNFYSSSDAQGFIRQEFCGDGEIIAYVSGITGNAWAGIAMRESDDSGAKMLQLVINGVGLARRTLRTSTGSHAFSHLFPNQGRHWLRLTRSGNIFGAFISSDGLQWDVVFLTQIAMSNCIQVGLSVQNKTPVGTGSVQFEQVEIKPPFGNGLQAPNNEHTIPQNYDNYSELNSDFAIYPNPSSGQVNLNLMAYMEQSLQVRIYNLKGQLVFRRDYTPTHSRIEKLSLEHLHDGLYLIQFKNEDQTLTKKLNISQ